MIIIDEIYKLTDNLNQYQRKFVEITKDLFSKIPEKHLSEECFVKFNVKSKLLEISLIHVESSDIPILYIIHSDMIEISCSSFIYFLDPMNKALFKEFSDIEFWIEAKRFIEATLKGNFWLTITYYKRKAISTEIFWKENRYPSYKQIHSFFYKKKKAIVQKHLCSKNFVD
jgi:hypothetical protein